MFRLVFLCYSLLFSTVIWTQEIPLAQARTMPAGSLVTVHGITLNGAELGSIRFLQDGTAGIALFPGSGSQPGFAASVGRGDSILVSGYLTTFNGLLEISPVLSYEILAKNRPLPPAKNLKLSQLSEAFESQLIRIDCLTFEAADALFSGSGAYAVSDGGGFSSVIYLATSNPLIGQPIPATPMRITGILSQYGNFQLLPRDPDDLHPATCFFLNGQPVQTEIETTGFRLSWETNFPARAKLIYGPEAVLLDQSILLSATSGTHTTTLNGLQPGSIYWVQVQAFTDQDTVFSKTLPFATRSTSSGQIEVYFNQGIDLAAANGLQPDGTTYEDVLNALIARINAAQLSIDAAIYNTNRSDLTFALRQAKERGVRVRYIAAQSTENSALKPDPGFPVLYGNSAALMHNKFLVIDAELPDQAWVMSGSMNWTNSNMIQDNNNTLFIQDQSLARTYELEFEEMWGGSGALPQPANSRFGNQKKDNTPHRFNIDGRLVECYFSPSDKATRQIAGAIEGADHQAGFAMFSFTKDEIGDALISEHNAGTWVRGLIENINDPGGEYYRLINNNVPVQAHPVHHKYAVLDAGYPMSDPTVITGSHNWTQAAESSNDENTLIIHDAALATLFQAEFERRWSEISTTTAELAGETIEFYPNPGTNFLHVRKNTGEPWSGHFKIRDVNGRLVDSGFHAGPDTAIRLKALPAGNYIVSLKTDHGITSFSIQALSP